MKRRTKAILSIFIVLFTLLIISAGLYANDYYHAENVEKYLQSEHKVQIMQVEEGYFFDGPGENEALIFYPGAKVEETAYSPIMRGLAERGIDCFLIKMPMKLAIFGSNKAEKIRSKYDYDKFYLAGHSLGGAMAADFVAKHLEDYDGLFLLAAYPTKDLTNASFPVAFIYGDCDGVLNTKKLEEGFLLAGQNSINVEITGANHAQFGSYGKQRSDESAKITPTQQWEITIQAILRAIPHD